MPGPYRMRLWNAWVEVEPTPDLRSVLVELTNRCNLDCRMCFKRHLKDPQGEMDFALFEKLLEDLKPFPQMEMVYLAGIGEPTCHPRFFDALASVKERGYAAGFSTNGLNLGEEGWERVVVMGVDLVYVSVDYLPARRGDLGHPLPEGAMEGIGKLQEIKRRGGFTRPSVGVEVVASSENLEDLPEQVKLLLSLGVDAVVISNLIPMDEEQAERTVYLKPDGERIKRVLDRLHSIAGRGAHVRIPSFELKTERRCDFDESSSAVVRWDGAVSPCYRFSHTYEELVFGRRKRINAFSFGNIRDESLYDIWMGRDYSVFRFVVKNYVYPSCTDCHLQSCCDFVLTADQDCWGNEPSCADCLWSRNLVLCPVPRRTKDRFV